MLSQILSNKTSKLIIWLPLYFMLQLLPSSISLHFCLRQMGCRPCCEAGWISNNKDADWAFIEELHDWCCKSIFTRPFVCFVVQELRGVYPSKELGGNALMFLTSTLSLSFAFDLLILYQKDAVFLKHVWNTRCGEYGEETLRQRWKSFGLWSDFASLHNNLGLYTNDPFGNLNS